MIKWKKMGCVLVDEMTLLMKEIQKTNRKEDINRLIKHFYNEIFAFCFKQTLDKTESLDLTQDIFLKFIKNIKSFDETKASIRTYLYRISNHHIIDYYRVKHPLLYNIEEYKNIHDDVSILEDLITNEEIKVVNLCLLQLNEEEQEIIRLRFYGDRSLQEISDILSKNLSSVKTVLYTALRKLKYLVKESDRNE